MGVKSLWTLLTPVGRPVMLETVEGRAMAIDSSIWIYQFQATMRDKEGQGLVNAHVLGFLRRISKLLFYGIKPVFVFDGGAPELKRSTLNERKQKKIGAAASHVKVAEKLLAAQMRREALNATQSTSKQTKQKSIALDDDTVYLEDVEGPSKTPKKTKRQRSPSSSAKKFNKYRDHDPYRLPEVDMEAKVTKATRSTVPDPRLATEEELRLFIEEMRPEDFDIHSPAFRELPTEIQYEIIGDLRLKSRQTSYARLQKMLQTSRTPLDFSKQQIQNLRQRNALTQQLLITTDSIGSAHIAIPVRIASERNKQYVLIKNESEAGGWVLGIRDNGTQEKPITIDHETEQEEIEGSGDSDMEEVQVLTFGAPDPMVRGPDREKALPAQQSAPHPFKPKPSLNSLIPPDDLSELDGELLSIAIEQSLNDSHLSQSIDIESQPAITRSSSRFVDADVTPPTHLETALTFAGTSLSHSGSPSKRPSHMSEFGSSKRFSEPGSEIVDKSKAEAFTFPKATISSIFGTPTLFTNPESTNFSPTSAIEDEENHPTLPSFQHVQESQTSSDEEFEEVPIESNVVALNVPTPFVDHEEMHQTQDLSPQRPSKSLFTNDAEDDLIEWSRTPSPMLDFHPDETVVHDQEWDAAHEVDAQAEEGEFARFLSQVKGKNMDDVRKEIDDEINDLNRQNRAAMRDSEDISQQMIAQIMTMLRLFGIPYITAPMEAEAQCAELLSLQLVDGVITDDSDVFLFGAQRVYKNMFNQSKTVECFLLSDLSRELGLDRDTLIRLAYLLGSDYTDGLPGVGPVVAMELLKEFPERDGLHKFKAWWTKVQSGKDREEDSQSKSRRQFKKKFKNLYLPSDWPNSAVRDAYYHPTVDSSKEPFKWGMPDLDGLRIFLHQELGWQRPKVDELLLPIVQQMNKRSQAAALNKQGDLNEFLAISSGSGTHAPRQRQPYASRRLQQVISDFRKQQKAGSATPESRPSSRATSRDASSGDERDDIEPPTAKKRKTQSQSTATRGKGNRTRKRSRADTISDDNDFVSRGDIATGELAQERNLRPTVKPRPAYRGAKTGNEPDRQEPS